MTICEHNPLLLLFYHLFGAQKAMIAGKIECAAKLCREFCGFCFITPRLSPPVKRCLLLIMLEVQPQCRCRRHDKPPAGDSASLPAGCPKALLLIGKIRRRRTTLDRMLFKAIGDANRIGDQLRNRSRVPYIRTVRR